MPSTKSGVAVFTIRIDLTESDLQSLIELLNGRLADTAALSSQIKQAYWDEKGPRLFQLPQLFDQLAAEVFPYRDLIAKRARALGRVAMETTRMAPASSSPGEDAVNATLEQERLKEFVERYAGFAAGMRRAINAAGEIHDRSNADLFAEISRTADEQSWFLEAHLQN